MAALSVLKTIGATMPGCQFPMIMLISVDKRRGCQMNAPYHQRKNAFAGGDYK
jgi:hypothetical protein